MNDQVGIALQKAEARSLRESCAVVDRSSADRLILRGEDRHRFLNGQMTCDVAALASGQGAYGFFTSAKGRIEADATVLAGGEELLLILPFGLGAPIRERLQRYIIFDQVELAEASAAARLTFVGPGAKGALEELSKAPPPEEVWEHRQVEVALEEATLVREGRLGDMAWSLWLPVGGRAAVLDHIETMEGCRLVGEAAFEAYRIEVGMSCFGLDFGPENLPQETGIDDAVSYTKGCYLGQEVVARLHYRGQVSRQLRRLEILGPFPGSVPADLVFEGRPAGTITSAAQIPGREHGAGIGLIQRRAFEPGRELEISTGGTAVVRGR